MRIGTWNLEGRWSDAHADVVTEMSCDVLLLTEVPHELDLVGYRIHRATALMSPGTYWCAVAYRGEGAALADPHPASASVRLGDLVVCCSVLPWLQWRAAGCDEPVWSGDQAERMASTVDVLVAALSSEGDVVWGGDWNTPLGGSLAGFSRAAQTSLLDAVRRLGLRVPTENLGSATDGCLSVDHVAVPTDAQVLSAVTVGVPRRLSDHWAYVVEADLDVSSRARRRSSAAAARAAPREHRRG